MAEPEEVGEAALALSPTVPGTETPDRLAQRLAREELKARLFGAPAESTRVGRFAVLRRIGAGGMGVVYAAYDEELDRKVALKMVKAGGPEAVERGKREAQALARLSHPNVVQVHDVGEALGQVYLAMEFVAGETLRAWQERAPRPWREVVAMYVQAGRGLAAAHARGLVHRDFKPENVLVGEDGRPRVVDFGIAWIDDRSGGTGDEGHVAGDRSEEARVTAPGVVLGTPGYMAPEQHRGGPADARSDVFSFCVALHEALHGAPPFAGARREEVLAAIEAGAVRRSATSAAPGWVQRAVERGLAADPSARWPGIEPLLAALGRDPTRWRRRALLAAVGAAAIAGGVWGWTRLLEQRQSAALAAERERAAAAEGDLARARAAAEARRLAAQSQQLAEGDPSLRLLLAIRAATAQREVGEPPSLEAEQALLDALDAPRSAPLVRAAAGIVDVVAESPDGRWLATGERDGTVALWDGAAPWAGPRATVAGAGAVRGLAFSADGGALAAVRAGGSPEAWTLSEGSGLTEHVVWDMTLGEPRDLAWGAGGGLLVREGARAFVLRREAPPRALAEGEAPLRRALWRPDGRATLTAAADGELRVWPEEAGARTLRLTAPPRGLLCADWSPDGRELVVGGADGTAAVVPVLGGAPLRLRGHTDEVVQAAFVPGGEEVVTVSRDGSARIWGRDGESERVPLEGYEESVLGAQLGPGREVLLGAPAGGEVWLWRLDVRGPPLRLRGHAGSVVHARFSADGARVLTASVDGTARRWHVADDPALLRGHAAGIERAEFLADGRTVVTASLDGTARVWPRDGRASVQLGGHREGGSLVLAASPEGRRLLTAGSDGRVRLWSWTTWPPVPQSSLPGERGPIVEAQWSPEGDRVALAGEDGRVHVVRVEAGGFGEATAFAAHAGPVRALRFLPSGLVSAGEDGRVHVWAVGREAVRKASFEGHSGAVRALAGVGARLVISAGDDAVARVWAPARPEAPVRELRGHLRAIAQVRVRPDGAEVLTASADGTARVWPLDAGEPEVLVGHNDAVWVAEWSPDGRTILTASADGTARLWTRRPGEGRVSLLLPRRAAGGPGDPDATLWTGGFSPDGALVVVAGADGLARVSVVDLADRLAEACARAGRDLEAEEWSRAMGAQPYRPTCPRP